MAAIRFAILLLIACVVHSFAALTTLSGDLPDTVYAASGPYLVVANVFVPSGAKTVVQAGSVLLFKNFTGLHVQGTLLCEGTSQMPIVFSSEFDKLFNPLSTMIPNPYDWNGIQIHEDALGTVLAFTKVLYSVYGVQSMTRFFKLIDAQFAGNGRGNCSISGVAQNIPDNKPYTYALTVRNAQSAGIPMAMLSDPDAPWRNTLRIGGLTLTLSGLGAAGYGAYQWYLAQQEITALSNTTVTDENSNLVKHTSADFIAAQNRRTVSALITAGSALLGICGVIGFSWSFTF